MVRPRNQAFDLEDAISRMAESPNNSSSSQAGRQKTWFLQIEEAIDLGGLYHGETSEVLTRDTERGKT